MVSDGDLIKSTDEPEIYLIDDGLRRWIPDEVTFESHWRWDQVQEQSPEVIRSFPLGRPIPSIEETDRSDVVLDGKEINLSGVVRTKGALQASTLYGENFGEKNWGDFYQVGVLGRSTSTSDAAVLGINTPEQAEPGNLATGVKGVSTPGKGVEGEGRTGVSGSGSSVGVSGNSYDVTTNEGGDGVSGFGGNNGVVGVGFNDNSIGLFGYGTRYGVLSTSDARIEGELTVTGAKNAVETVDTPDGEREVVYTAIEAGEVQTEHSGVARLENGRTEITLPEHFGLITSEEAPLIVQVTPYGGTTGLKVTERSTDRLVIEELEDEPGSYEFAYTVKGTRKGFEDKEVVREPPTESELPIGPTVPDHLSDEFEDIPFPSSDRR